VEQQDCKIGYKQTGKYWLIDQAVNNFIKHIPTLLSHCRVHQTLDESAEFLCDYTTAKRTMRFYYIDKQCKRQWLIEL
jgi:hypothetical protein